MVLWGTKDGSDIILRISENYNGAENVVKHYGDSLKPNSLIFVV